MAFDLDDALCPLDLLKGSGLLNKPGNQSIIKCAGLLLKPRFAKNIVIKELLEVASWVGVIRDIEAGETIPIEWGVRPTKTGIVSLRSGNLVGITVVLEDTNSIGNINFAVQINGIAQNLVGQVYPHNGQTGTFEFSPAIAISTEDVVDVCAQVSTDWDATIGVNGTVTLYYTQTGFTIPPP